MLTIWTITDLLHSSYAEDGYGQDSAETGVGRHVEKRDEPGQTVDNIYVGIYCTYLEKPHKERSFTALMPRRMMPCLSVERTNLFLNSVYQARCRR